MNSPAAQTSAAESAAMTSDSRFPLLGTTSSVAASRHDDPSQCTISGCRPSRATPVPQRSSGAVPARACTIPGAADTFQYRPFHRYTRDVMSPAITQASDGPNMVSDDGQPPGSRARSGIQRRPFQRSVQVLIPHPVSASALVADDAPTAENGRSRSRLGRVAACHDRPFHRNRGE
jgi:hypothetical protein